MTLLFKNRCHTAYPIPHERLDAWMVQVCPDAIGSISGKVICADALDKPKY
jgi:hypothetical protein